MNKCFFNFHYHTFKKLPIEGFWDSIGRRKVDFYKCSCGKEWMWDKTLFGAVESTKHTTTKHEVPKDINQALDRMLGGVTDD